MALYLIQRNTSHFVTPRINCSKVYDLFISKPIGEIVFNLCAIRDIVSICSGTPRINCSILYDLFISKPIGEIVFSLCAIRDSVSICSGTPRKPSNSEKILVLSENMNLDRHFQPVQRFYYQQALLYRTELCDQLPEEIAQQYHLHGKKSCFAKKK